jgi:hypothetical protein
MFNKFTIPLCAVAMAAAMAPMTADALGTFTFQGATAGASKLDFATVNADRRDGGGDNRNNLGAGGFDMKQTSPDTPFGEFIAWCFEIDDPLVISDAGTTSYTQEGVLNADQRARVQKTFDANYHNAAITTDKTTSAAFQLALWEVIYDDNFSLASGDFKSSTGGTLRGIADGFLTAANDYTGAQKWVITELKSDTAQDLGTVNAIPLPAAAWLLLGVSGALVGAKRRSARKNA